MIIYKITNLINRKIYIGQHNGKYWNNYYGGGKLVKFAIKKYGKENFTRDIIIEGNYNQEFIDYLEKHYIRLYASTFPNYGYNIQTGGRGDKGWLPSKEFIEKSRKRMIGNTIMLGRKRSEESNKKHSITYKNILKNTPKEILRERAIKAAVTRKKRYDIGKLISDSRKANKKIDWDNKQTKPIVQETLNGDFIKLWASSYQVEKEVGMLSSRISAVCNNYRGCKTYKGFKWRFSITDK